MTINECISKNDIIGALSICLNENKHSLGLLLAKSTRTSHQTEAFINQFEGYYRNSERDNTEIKEVVTTTFYQNKNTELNTPLLETEKTRVLLYCNWTSSEELCKIWNKMSKGEYTWNNIQIVWEEPADYYVVVNCPPINIFPAPEKTILFRMEPNMEKHPHNWGQWANPKEEDYFFTGLHHKHYNNNEWHLSKTYDQLSTEQVIKDESLSNVLSTVLSDKYKDSGHIKRVDFTKFLETKGLSVHVFGGNKFGWKDYKGSLPYHQKDSAMFPYKYGFNAENQPVKGYYTEKLIDGILSETLMFYNGCPDIKEYIDEKAFVWLELSNFEADYNKIKTAIESNLWEERLPFIKAAKEKILNESQFFPRIEKIINGL